MLCVFLNLLSTSVFKTVSLCEPEAHQLRYRDLLWLSRAWIADVHCCDRLVSVDGWGSEFRYSYLLGKHVTDLTISPVPSWYS